MDWVHCNNCAGRPGQNKLYLNACGHVFCHNCCGKAKDRLCYICQKPLKPSEINKSLRPDLLDFFKDPIKISNDGCAEIKQVATFQAKQREYYVKFRNSESKRETDSFNEARVAYMKIAEDMEKRKKALSEENERSKKEKDRKKQLVERLHTLQREVRLLAPRFPTQVHLSRIQTEPVPSKIPKFRAPQHLSRRGSHEKPTHQLLDQSTSRIVTSTPIANIDFSRREYLNRMFCAGMAHPSPIPRH